MNNLFTQFFHWHDDGSHAWLQVPIALLFDLHIEEKISYYSYMEGKYAYLEEDCDASTFLNAIFESSKWYENPILMGAFRCIPRTYFENGAPCREFKSFDSRNVKL